MSQWINRDRVLAWTGVLLTLEVVVLGASALWSYGFFSSVGKGPPTDFLSFYAAGKLALNFHAWQAYVQSYHAAAEAAAIGFHNHYVYFYYPPVFLLLCALLALLPLRAAFLVFEAASLGAFLAVMNRILRPETRMWFIPVLAYPAVIWTLFLGQNSFITAASVGATTLLLEKRPTLAGVALGMMCYKPNLSLVAPIALIAGWQWKAFWAAGATVATLVAGSQLLFGSHTWLQYFSAMSHSGSVYDGDLVTLGTYVTTYGAILILGGSGALALAAQALMSLVTAGLVFWIWRQKTSIAMRSTALVAGMLLSTPVARMYDLTLLMVGMGWLVREARDTGFLPWEKPLLVFCFMVPMASPFLGQILHVPIGPLAPAALLVICLVRIRHRAAPQSFRQNVGPFPETPEPAGRTQR
jgi:hypothetical protein